MQRYMIQQELVNPSLEQPIPTIQLNEDYFHHMHNVMRFKPGNQVYLTDPKGFSWVAEITAYQDAAVELRWVREDSHESELPVQVTIACGLSKGDKLELIVQKGTELGAAAVVPFTSRYAVVKWDDSKSRKKRERYQRIAMEAAEQSHRRSVPDIESHVSLKQLAKRAADYDHCLVAYEEQAKAGEKGTFAQTLNSLKPGERLLIVFGPEGGLAPEEVELLQSHGFKSCALGPRILRAETAPLYALAAISYHFELQNPAG